MIAVPVAIVASVAIVSGCTLLGWRWHIDRGDADAVSGLRAELEELRVKVRDLSNRVVRR